MNKELNIIYPNNGDNFDLKDFYPPEEPKSRAGRVKKVMRQASQEASYNFLCLLRNIIFVIVAILIVAGGFFAIERSSHRIKPELGYNPNNPCGIVPSTGERLFEDCSFSPELNR